MAATPEHAARVLGLDDNATLENVRDVRRTMAMKYHPDGSKDVERSTRHMARINAAADVLIAHIKALGVKSIRPDYADFSDQYKSSRASKPKMAAEMRSTPEGAKSDEKHRQHCAAKAPDARDTAKQVTAIAQPKHCVSSTERELIRFAMTSYRTVLNQIGKATTGPTIDTTALAYPAHA